MTGPRTSFKANLEGRGLVTIRPSDHIATGGEGSIYRVGSDTAVKIYSDPSEMSRQGLAEKIRALTQLKSPYIVAPSGLARSEKREPIGYYMPYAEGHPLSRVFTTDFWNREGFSRDHAIELVSRMRETVAFAHAHSAILVDPNELNWLVKFAKNDPEPRIVDVDSWSIGRWPASVIMPSIRDYHSNHFDEKSDWFSWGIVTFQVFTGLHPYKGTHPSYKRHDFIKRMKANASVFSPDVRLNHAVRDFSLIPKSLLDWYQATFQKCVRTTPPSVTALGEDHGRAALTLRVKATGQSGLLVFEKLFEEPNDPVVRIFSSGAILLASGTLIEPRSRRRIAERVSFGAEVVRTPDGWLIAERSFNSILFRYALDGNVSVESLPFSLEGKALLRFEDRLFTLSERGLTEVKLHLFGTKALVSAGQTWSVMPNATMLFDGLGIMDAMGATFLVLPSRDGGVSQARVRELDGWRVVLARAGERLAVIVAVNKSGEYQRFDFWFSKDYSSYRLDIHATDEPNLNLAILPRGVIASIQEEGELTITVPSTSAANLVKDKAVTTGMMLGNFENQVVYVERGALWTVRMK